MGSVRHTFRKLGRHLRAAGIFSSLVRFGFAALFASGCQNVGRELVKFSFGSSGQQEAEIELRGEGRELLFKIAGNAGGVTGGISRNIVATQHFASAWWQPMVRKPPPSATR